MAGQRNRRRWLVVVGVAGLVGSACWIISNLATGGLETADQTSSVVAAFATLISLALTVFPLLFPQSSEWPDVDEFRARLTKQLAGKVRELSEREEEHQRVDDPRPLPVQWQTARDELFDHWDNILGTAEQTPSGAMSLTGRFTNIRETYEAVPSGRLVILGKAGAGKTVLAHRLILASLDQADRTGPVPVLFSLGDWDPTSTSLRDWMVPQLVRDYTFLDAPEGTAS